MLLAVGAWVDSVVARPGPQRLAMRFVAAGIEPPARLILAQINPYPMKLFGLLQNGRVNAGLPQL